MAYLILHEESDRAAWNSIFVSVLLLSEKNWNFLVFRTFYSIWELDVKEKSFFLKKNICIRNFFGRFFLPL